MTLHRIEQQTKDRLETISRDYAEDQQRRLRLIHFLQDELCIPPEAIALALKKTTQRNLLPIVLWQYGAITLQQLDRVFDWLEAA